MHELAIMENVLKIVVEFGQKNNAQEIKHINLVTGSLSNIIPHWAELFFQMIAQDTMAENAKLGFTITPARINCRKCQCDTEFTSDNMIFNCAYCGSDEITLVSGREFHIDSIEIIVKPDDMV